MTPFELAEPATLKEAISLLDPDDVTVRPIAGGTALMPLMKAGVFRPSRLVSLHKVLQLTAIDAANGELTIGAMTPLAVLERSAAVKSHAPVITRTLRTLSNIRVRNVATIGGSLAHADPHMDLPPVLIALGARVTVTGRAGERTLPVEELFAGYFETALARDELITSVVIPSQGSRRAVYLKCTTRAVHDWPALGIAVSLDADGSTIKSARIVISAATEKATRLKALERGLTGAIIDVSNERDIRLIRDIVDEETSSGEAQLISDGQGSAAYKKQLVRVYVARALAAALKDGGR